ncbi:MAG: accessory gene regulator B family protein [Peptostreptococcaceae bacterium]|nr:accessory gene regulator B family protein [Peptostreptococcaceae bacterium]
MELIERMSYNIALKIGSKTNKTNEEIEVINYGVFVIIHTIIALILTALTGYIIRKPIQIIIITIISASLKRYSGGVHATSPNRCLIIGILISLISVYISEILFKYNNSINLIIISLISIFLSIIIFYKKAPVGNKNKPLKKVETRNIMRKKLFFLLKIYYISILVFSIMILNGSLTVKYVKYIYCIQLGVLLQAFSITNIGEVIVLKLDEILNNIKKVD